jgi:hypothetical protein
MDKDPDTRLNLVLQDLYEQQRSYFDTPSKEDFIRRNTHWYSVKTEYPNGEMITIIQPTRGLEWEIQGLAEEYLKTHRITNYHIFKHDFEQSQRPKEISSFSVCPEGQMYSFEQQLESFSLSLSSMSERGLTKEMVGLVKQTLIDLHSLREQFEKEYDTEITPEE